jgi:hypothetical protein
MWPWREWVISAFNRNLPFDQFTIEQLAGDLLPSPTLEQRIDTGLHRNHMINAEGGAIPKEFIAEYTADRLETTASVWLGQTFNCTRCHDHKYDPFTQFFLPPPPHSFRPFGNPDTRLPLWGQLPEPLFSF